jgi:competence ComEA-like helix-hairpin-helix protein
MKNFFKEYFSFSLTERKGIWVLIILIILVILSPVVYKFFFKDNADVPDKRLIAEFDKALKTRDTAELKKSYTIPGNFDPNEYTESEWLSIGVKQQVAARIGNYLSKGGRFYKKEDLLKIYGFDSSLYNSIYTYIDIKSKYTVSKKASKQFTYNKKNAEYIPEIIELNSADTIDLNKLSGIGSTFSNRIIKYRNMLGGFYSVEQLTEVYGLNKNLVEDLTTKISIDTSLLKRIDLNTAPEKILRNHPYIGKYKASAIIKLRNYQKSGIHYTDLYKNGIFSKTEAEKLQHYLK